MSEEIEITLVPTQRVEEAKAELAALKELCREYLKHTWMMGADDYDHDDMKKAQALEDKIKEAVK